LKKVIILLLIFILVWATAYLVVAYRLKDEINDLTIQLEDANWRLKAMQYERKVRSGPIVAEFNSDSTQILITLYEK
jgi:hypothetical protein